MKKIVINLYKEGLGLSEEAIQRYELLSSKKFDDDIPRHDKYLVQVVEQMGILANDKYSRLVVVEIPGKKYSVSSLTKNGGAEDYNYPESEDWIVIE
jgi:hypothetical protein